MDRLVAENRSFVKGLQYNLGRLDRIASAVLTDCDGAAPTLLVLPAGCDGSAKGIDCIDQSTLVWVWRTADEPMPALPSVMPRRAITRAWAASTRT